MAQKDTAAGVTEEKTAEKAAAPKFPVEKLAAHCRQSFWRFLLHLCRGDARHDGRVHRRRNESAHQEMVRTGG